MGNSLSFITAYSLKGPRDKLIFTESTEYRIEEAGNFCVSCFLRFTQFGRTDHLEHFCKILVSIVSSIVSYYYFYSVLEMLSGQLGHTKIIQQTSWMKL